MLIGVILAAVLLLLGLGTLWRQSVLLEGLRQRTHIPSDERVFLQGQIRRRNVMAGVLVILGLLIGGSFLGGIEAHATELGERQQTGQTPDENDKRFLQLYTGLWIIIILLLAGLISLSLVDAWAARRYWMGVFHRLREDHNILMQRDLALYRQQRLEEREARIRRGLEG